MAEAEIHVLYPRTDAPVQPLAPRPFGQRKPGYLAGGFAEVLERPEDRAQQENFKRIRRDLKAAERAALGDAGHVHPSLLTGLAARIAGLATAAETLAEEAKSYGLLRAAVQLREHASLFELLAAETDPTPPEMPA